MMELNFTHLAPFFITCNYMDLMVSHIAVKVGSYNFSREAALSHNSFTPLLQDNTFQ